MGNLDNVIIFVARQDPASGNDLTTYAAHPATVEVGYVEAPDMTVTDTQTQKLSFAGTQKDRVVPNPGT